MDGEVKRNWTIRLGDGTRLEGLSLNGNNFVSEVRVNEETFYGKLRNVRIEYAEPEEGEPDPDMIGIAGEHARMEVVRVSEQSGEWWFILRDVPEEELEAVRLRGDVDYLAMMTGVEL